jgi:site-specific recombinase XerC
MRLLLWPFLFRASRRQFATHAYRGSRNLRAVQTLLGHSSVATTGHYTAVEDDEVRAAMLAAL